MFAEIAHIKPWELGQLTVEQLHQGRLAFDARLKDQEDANT